VDATRTVALCAALACAALLPLAMPDAGAEGTYLRLDPVPRLVEGERATFTGVLVAASGRPVSGALVEIKDDDPGFDDLIATARTGGDGRFSARVVVKDWDRWGGASDIYAVFEGGGGFSKSRSATQEAPVLPAGSQATRQHAGQQSGSPQSGAYAAPSYPTDLRLYSDKSRVYAGETVTFSGTLTSNGRALSGATVHIKEDDPFWRDEFLASVKTDSNGRFSAVWTASAARFETEFEVYAVFEGSASYQRDRTPNYLLSVFKRSGSITLDPIPRGVHIGEPVTFSGRLSLQGIDTTNVIVHIKDEDALNPDDLLATAYVDGGGRYAVTWIAEKVDADRVADIYAVFEGDSGHYRLTTCDPNPTRSFGGLCRDTRPLSTWPARQVAPPGPPNTEYVALNYVIPFQGRPTVAISPSPDSYDKARHHVIPAREGIEVLASELAARHGGDWRVNFEVLTPGKWRADTRADIVVNIVTGDDAARCNDWLGWAPTSPRSFPIQVSVCSTQDDRLRPSQGVMRTATHEFAHAMGLGHAFNRGGDMMCSIENSRSTCPPSPSKEARPSGLVLDAMAALYGRDGYTVPNNSPGRYFTASMRESPTSWGAPPAAASAAGSGTWGHGSAKAAAEGGTEGMTVQGALYTLASAASQPADRGTAAAAAQDLEALIAKLAANASQHANPSPPIAMSGQHTDRSLGVSFWYPVGWDVMDGSEPGTPRVLVVGPDTGSLQPPAVVIAAIDHAGGIDAYAKAAVEARLGSDTYSTISGPTEAAVGGSRALVTVTAAAGQDGSEELRFHEIAIAHGDVAYSVVYMSAPEDYDAHLPHLESMVETMGFFGGA